MNTVYVKLRMKGNEVKYRKMLSTDEMVEVMRRFEGRRDVNEK